MGARRQMHRGASAIYLAAILASLLVAGPSLAAQLSLTWTHNATNESGIRIERSPNPADTYAEGQNYCYRVRACDLPNPDTNPWQQQVLAASARRSLRTTMD